MSLASNQPKKVPLIVEKADGELWGRVKVKGNLITDSAPNLSALKAQIKQLVLDFENIEVSGFEVSYDLTSFFQTHSYVNLTEVAEKSGIDYALMRQYAAGKKFPSQDRVLQIEKAIHEIGKELTKVRLHKAEKVPA